MVTTTQQPEPAPEPGPEPAFEGWADADDAPRAGEALIVNLDGFEGPLDLLLALARTQKVDLAKISVLALAEQYLEFVNQALKARLELAADYLVMAAWLAFLKSKLLLPREEGHEDQPTGDELAARLAFRLMRLEAMRHAAGQLVTRKRLGRDVFTRGNAGRRAHHPHAQVYGDDLRPAEGLRRSAQEARSSACTSCRGARCGRSRRRASAWRACSAKASATGCSSICSSQRYGAMPDIARTARASSFGATLEMAREGLVELSQAEPFAPIYMRRREEDAEWQRIT